MARMVQCKKLGRELPGLGFKPFPNELGQRVYDSISQDAWKMWLEHFKMVLNEYRLAPGDPRTNQILYAQAEAFFFGEGDGHLDALDADTGRVLWRHACPSGANAPPVTYEVDGVQYVAVAAGGNPMFGFKAGQTLIAFALPPGAGR